jgi:peptidoglycan/xylan/chitin deacetylase (PgdA/CDA1 family)
MISGAGKLPATTLDSRTVSVPGPVHPLDNNASAGKVVFTFDDGPDVYTQALLNELKALHLPAVFFCVRLEAEAYPKIIREELADGDRVENHTWDHPSFTGASTDTPPLSAAKIKAELAATQQAIVAVGAPKPTLYRPPFGDITAKDNKIAASLGLRLVEPFSVTPAGKPIDSRDWTGISAAQITRDVTHG